MQKKDKILMTMMIVMSMIVLFFAPAGRIKAASGIDPDRSCSLTLTLKSGGDEGKVASGAKVTAYLVAKAKVVNGGLDYELTKDYLDSDFDPDIRITQSVIDDLADYTSEKGLSGITAVSDGKGKVVFDEMPQGIYLIMAAELPKGFTSFVPFLYSLPYYSDDDGDFRYDGIAEPKISFEETTEVNVRKVWKDDGKDRPDHVTIRLYKDGVRYEDVRLSDANHWKYNWTDLDASSKWTVKEIDVPDGYKVTYKTKGVDITITNTKSKADPGGKKRKRLIQTGQLDLPVAVMVFTGMFLISAGIIVKVTGRKNEE